MEDRQGTNKNQIIARIATAALCVLAVAAIVLVNREQPAAGGDRGTVQESEASQTAEPEKKTVRALDFSFPRKEKYEFPFLGMTVYLPENLKQHISGEDIAMLPFEDWAEDAQSVNYAYLSWELMTREQSQAEVELSMEGYQAWVDSLNRIGTLGMYRQELAGKLDELTGCTQHKKLGESADGTYQCYLSVNPQADAGWVYELGRVRVQFTEMIPFQGDSVFSDPAGGQKEPETVGIFETEDILGQPYTQTLFGDYELTLVNVFTTWCGPCVAEIPELERLYQELGTQGVGVVGIMADSVDQSGRVSPNAVETAKALREQTGATYPFLIPDASGLNGRLEGIMAVPETFFVDQNGTIVGETYVGSRSLEQWKAVVETELARLRGAGQ